MPSLFSLFRSSPVTPPLQSVPSQEEVISKLAQKILVAKPHSRDDLTRFFQLCGGGKNQYANSCLERIAHKIGPEFRYGLMASRVEHLEAVIFDARIERIYKEGMGEYSFAELRYMAEQDHDIAKHASKELLRRIYESYDCREASNIIIDLYANAAFSRSYDPDSQRIARNLEHAVLDIIRENESKYSHLCNLQMAPFLIAQLMTRHLTESERSNLPEPILKCLNEIDKNFTFVQINNNTSQEELHLYYREMEGGKDHEKITHS